jgi:putative ATPase
VVKECADEVDEGNGHGEAYKTNPNYVDGRVRYEYLPQKLGGRRFLEERDLGTEFD